MRDKINLLLGIHNGSRFIDSQLQSIDSQTLSPFFITVRDDGSVDDSLRHVKRWAAERPDVHILHGPRLGAAENFFKLLSFEDKDCNYFAFCDQDDVWLPDKLERAVGAIRKYSSADPVMYCSRVEYVDEHLQHLGYSSIPKRPSFANALVENIATGCTVVLNRSARDLICGKLPCMALMHDWWCYLVLSAFGTVHYDERPCLKYRQHGGNVVGGTSVPVEEFKRRLDRFFKSPRNHKLLTDQAEEFSRLFGEALSFQQKAILDRFLSVRGNLRARLAYNLTMDVWRQTWVDTAILRTMILIGRV
jgi:glycosyltransferase involved in cell wall biosynthesis